MAYKSNRPVIWAVFGAPWLIQHYKFLLLPSIWPLICKPYFSQSWWITRIPKYPPYFNNSVGMFSSPGDFPHSLEFFQPHLAKEVVLYLRLLQRIVRCLCLAWYWSLFWGFDFARFFASASSRASSEVHGFSFFLRVKPTTFSGDSFQICYILPKSSFGACSSVIVSRSTSNLFSVSAM